MGLSQIANLGGETAGPLCFAARKLRSTSRIAKPGQWLVAFMRALSHIPNTGKILHLLNSRRTPSCAVGVLPSLHAIAIAQPVRCPRGRCHQCHRGSPVASSPWRNRSAVRDFRPAPAYNLRLTATKHSGGGSLLRWTLRRESLVRVHVGQGLGVDRRLSTTARDFASHGIIGASIAAGPSLPAQQTWPPPAVWDNSSGET